MISVRLCKNSIVNEMTINRCRLKSNTEILIKAISKCGDQKAKVTALLGIQRNLDVDTPVGTTGLLRLRK